MERQNASRAAATQVRLRVAVHAGEVTFDGHGVVGEAQSTHLPSGRCTAVQVGPGQASTGRVRAHHLEVVLRRGRASQSGCPPGHLPKGRLRGEGCSAVSLAPGSRAPAGSGTICLTLSNSYPAVAVEGAQGIRRARRPVALHSLLRRSVHDG